MKLTLSFENNQIEPVTISVPLELLENVCAEWVKIRTFHTIGKTISGFISEQENKYNSKIHYIKFINYCNVMVDAINVSDERHKYSYEHGFNMIPNIFKKEQ